MGYRIEWLNSKVFQGYKHFFGNSHGTIFSGGPRPCGKICKRLTNLKMLRTAALISCMPFLHQAGKAIL